MVCGPEKFVPLTSIPQPQANGKTKRRAAPEANDKLKRKKDKMDRTSKTIINKYLLQGNSAIIIQLYSTT